MNEDILKRLETLERTVAEGRSDAFLKKGLYAAFALVWCFGWALLPKLLR